MKKMMILLTGILILLSFSGCSSIYIKYSDDLKNRTITAKLYLPALPGAEVKVAGLINARDEIQQNFRNIDIKEIIIDEFEKVPVEKQKRVILAVDNALSYNLSVPINNTYIEDKKTNPFISNYRFSTIAGKIGVDYILVLKIDRIVWDSTGYLRGVYLEGVASMHDVKNNSIVWSAPVWGKKNIGITDGPAKDITELKKGIALSVDLICEQIFDEING